jgi:hypothetical protein
MARKKSRRPRTRPQPANVRAAPLKLPAASWVDHELRKVFLFTDDMLVNQLRRDGPEIEQSFDRLCYADLQEMSVEFSRASSIIFSGLAASRDDKDKLRFAIAQLLMNGSNSFASAVALLRMGFVFQPGIILRSMLETISTSLHLLLKPADLQAYEAHALKSPKTIAAAKKAIPNFGLLYGHFSDNFAHIGILHKSLMPLSPFTEKHDGLSTNLRSLRIILWLFYVTVELVFLDLVGQPRYWKRIDNGYAFSPDDAERARMAQFLDVENAL